jgi:hypothetical protein
LSSFFFFFFGVVVLDMSIYYASDRVAARMDTRNPFGPKKPMGAHTQFTTESRH